MCPFCDLVVTSVTGDKAAHADHYKDSTDPRNVIAMISSPLLEDMS